MREKIKLSKYLSEIRVSPLPLSDIPEESAPDLPVAETSSPATELVTLSVNPFPDGSSIFKFFVDGVQRTVPIGEIDIGGIHVPIHIAHLIVGAMKREGNQLKPYIRREAFVLIFPLGAIKAAGVQIGDPPFEKLDFWGNIYNKIKSNDGGIFFSDSSISLEIGAGGTPKILLQAGDLIKTGEVRRKALDRSKVLLRIMEIGMVWELRNSDPNDWIILDGPIAPSLKYSRLVGSSLQGLQDIARPDMAFDFLSRVAGAVKRVQIIPQSGLNQALNPGNNLIIPIYQFGNLVQDDDAVAQEILSAFVWLRRELSNEVSIIWSSVSGLARFDIPLPAILDESCKNNWNTALDENNIRNFLNNQSSPERQKLEQIINSIVLERWPIPSSSPSRMLTELFPIEETERWLSSQLLSIFELRTVL